MHAPQKSREENPFRKLSQSSQENPGMYLIALRAHLGRGKSMISDMIDSVAEALPKATKLREADEA